MQDQEFIPLKIGSRYYEVKKKITLKLSCHLCTKTDHKYEKQSL